jgi:membrane protease YdiL (CAAX protease family)
VSGSEPEVESRGIGPYWFRAREPLQILVFVLPLAVIYEIGLFAASRGGWAQPRLLAYRKVEEAFEAMGLATAGSALPAILIVVAILAWQILGRRPWKVHWPTTLVMAAESLALAFPLLLFAVLVTRGGVATQAADGEAESVLGRVLMSVGAGLYEEFLFRWITIATLHALLVDGLRLAERTATAIAVVVSSGLFMLAHGSHDATYMAFYFGSGVFFSLVYVLREFGIAAGTHVAYDVLVELLAAARG